MIKNTFFLAALTLLHAAPLQAALIAHEPFNYESPTITSSTVAGGQGFTGNWIVGQGSITVASNLNYSGVPSSGSAGVSNGPTRGKELLATPIDTGLTVYTTFILKGGGNAGSDGAGFILTGLTGNLFVGFGSEYTATESRFGMGSIDGGNSWANPTSFSIATQNLSTTETYFIALKTSGDTTNLWINPPIADLVAGTMNVPNLTMGGVILGSVTGFGLNSPSAATTIDEVRIGTDWASVAGVPEPSGAGIIAVAGLILLSRRRKS
ncbi:MAG: hypothetical protein EOP84_17355 [Verrucomicrobiaceae bacterium]|nr:MAG: hypothetical protein EOP84_17355 [Verrucomicrobiaceae bacterium]